MGRDSEERRRKRQKIDETDSERNRYSQLDEIEKPSAEKNINDKSSRSEPLTIAGKRNDMESPRSVSKDMFPDHGGKVVDTLLSLSHGNATEGGEANTPLHRERNELIQTSTGGDDLEELRRNALQKLKQLVHKQERELEDGWEVEIIKKRGRVEKFFVSPTKRKFRTWPDVARHLGLSGKTSKGGSVERKANQRADSTTPIQSSPPVIERSSPLHASTKHHVKQSRALKLGETNFDAGQNMAMQPSPTLASQRCQDVFRSVISTDKFGMLCSMFQNGPSAPWEKGLQTSALITGALDFQLLNLRMTAGIYGEKPELFLADLQQVWINIRSIGNELSVLANALSELSDNLYKEQVASLFSMRMEDESIDDTNADLVPEHGISLYVPASEQEPPEDLTAKDAVEPVENPHKSIEDTQYVTAEVLPLTHVAQVISKPPSSGKKGRKISNSKRHVQTMSSHIGANASNKRPCRICGGMEDNDFLTCSSCGGGYHVHCSAPMAVKNPEISWSCLTCTAARDNKEDSLIELSLDPSEVHSQEPIQLPAIPKDSLQHLSTSGNVNVNVNVNVNGESLKVSKKDNLCKLCGKDDHEVLLCDSCESAHHMYCLSPALDKVPEGSWYCPICVEDRKKTESLNSQQDLEHEQHGKLMKEPSHHCAVCDRINEVEEPSSPVVKNNYAQGHTNGLGRVCKLCGVDDKSYLLCCDACSKPYHMTCLKPPLKKIPTSTYWYCPSCLCRVCKVDADDEKIILCDECDEGYHIYCLSPPLEDIPLGSWFCPSCSSAKKLSLNIHREESVKPMTLELRNNTSEVLKKDLPKRKRKSAEPKRST